MWVSTAHKASAAAFSGIALKIENALESLCERFPDAELFTLVHVRSSISAAIERLRGTTEGSSHVQEAARAAPETPRTVSAPPVQPLPPPIMVSTPTADDPPYTANVRIAPSRPTPPADIPPPSRPPLDLHADATDPPAHPHTNVAEEMLSAAKSMFHAVLPNSSAK